MGPATKRPGIAIVKGSIVVDYYDHIRETTF